jgi:hypothetical protein
MIGNDTSQTPPPYSGEVAAFLAHARVVGPAPAIVRARLMARAQQALREEDVVFPARKAASPVRRLLYAAAAGLVLMAGAAAAYQILRRPEPSPPANGGSPAAESHAQVVPPAEPAPEPPSAPQAGPEATAPTAPAAFPKASAPSRRTGLTGKNEARLEELRLLVRARQADVRGDYLSVLTVLAEHERSFPSGRLSEEREVLRVKALVGLGRADDARQVGASFRRQFPHSVLLHKVDEMLASLR